MAASAVGTRQAKECDPDPSTGVQENVDPGQLLGCEAELEWAQTNPNTPFAIVINNVIDSVPPTTPSMGPVMIIAAPTVAGILSVPGEPAIANNAICSGAACNPATGAGCSFPCLVCGPGRNDISGTLQCPGAIGAGIVHTRDVTNVAPTPTAEQCAVDNPVPIDDRVSWFEVQDCTDNANLPIPGCSTVPFEDQKVDTSFINCPGCPYVEIDKTCERVNADGNCYGDVTIVVSNGANATASAKDCAVTDTLDPDGVHGPATNPTLYEADGVTPAIQPFDLAVGATRTFKAKVGPLTAANTVNEATVACAKPTEPPAIPDTCKYEDTDRANCICGDNYKCYTVKPVPRTERFPATTVGLEDQFRTTSARLLTPYEFCNPVDKNGEGIGNPDGHLMCYKFIDRGRAASVPVEVTDQFGPENLRTSSANVLCVPALKNCDPLTDSCSIGALEEELNHFQCYGALPLLQGDTLLTPPGPVQLRDQFTDSLVTFPTVQRRHLCTPTSKNGGGVPDETEHLKCYDIRDEERFLGTEINVIDQFGTWDLRVGQARELCESAEKTRLDRRPVDDTRSR
jgi:hypothetical protein